MDNCYLSLDYLQDEDQQITVALQQTASYLARREIHHRDSPQQPLIFPPYDRSSLIQVPLIPRKFPNTTKPLHIINRSCYLYARWKDILQRCFNDKNKAYNTRYGCRTITGDWCPRTFTGPNPLRENHIAFLQFFITIEATGGRRPHPDWSLDRIKINAGYQPNNLRWASPKTQATNQAVKREKIPFMYSNPNLFKAISTARVSSNNTLRNFRQRVHHLGSSPNNNF